MVFVFIGTGEAATFLRVVSFYMKNPLNVILVTDAIEKHFAHIFSGLCVISTKDLTHIRMSASSAKFFR